MTLPEKSRDVDNAKIITLITSCFRMVCGRANPNGITKEELIKMDQFSLFVPKLRDYPEADLQTRQLKPIETVNRELKPILLTEYE